MIHGVELVDKLKQTLDVFAVAVLEPGDPADCFHRGGQRRVLVGGGHADADGAHIDADAAALPRVFNPRGVWLHLHPCVLSTFDGYVNNRPVTGGAVNWP